MEVYRVSARRRAIGAAFIMAVVVVLLPMMLNHSKSPKLKQDPSAQLLSTPQGAPLSQAENEVAQAHSTSSLSETHTVNTQASSLSAAPGASSQAMTASVSKGTVVANAPLSAVSNVNATSPNSSPTTKNDKAATGNPIVPGPKASVAEAQQNQIIRPVKTAEATPSSTTADPLVTPAPQAEKKKPVAESDKSKPAATNRILQLGLFAEEARAKTLVKEVKGRGSHAKIEKILVNHKWRYRVYAGPFTSNDKLHKTKKQLQDAGFPTLVKEHH